LPSSRLEKKTEIDKLAQKSWLSKQAHQLRKREEDLRLSLVQVVFSGAFPGPKANPISA
jgi:hypothetical protein